MATSATNGFDQSTFVPAPFGLPLSIPDLCLSWVGFIAAKDKWEHRGFVGHNINLIARGRGTYRVDNGPTKRITAGSMFVVWPGPVFHYGPDEGETWDEYFVCAAGVGVERWLERGWFPTDGCVRTMTDLDEPVRLMREIMQTMGRAQRGDPERAVLLTERFLLEALYRSAAGPSERGRDPGLEAVLAHFRQNYGAEMDFQRIASAHALSYSKLRQGVRRLTGLAPGRYLARLRCEAARVYLSRSDLSVKQIAARVGIADPAVFCRTFRRCVGQSPEQYRRHMADDARSAPRRGT